MKCLLNISTYISNCHNTLARLLIIGGTELLSKEGATKRDPTAMAAYALGVTPLIQNLLEMTSSNKLYSKETTYADVVCCAIWYHLHNLKNVKNNHGGVLIFMLIPNRATHHTCLYVTIDFRSFAQKGSSFF